jgi:hypothetical protein
LVDGGPTATTSTTGDCDTASPDATDWIDCTRIQSGLSSLTVNQTVASWSGTGSFTQAVAADPNEAQFKRITLAASWGDASGGSHQLAIASDVSSLGLTNSLIPPPSDQDSGGGGPTVHTISPATAGVIPIAMGNGDSSAASNPTPELVGSNQNQKIVGTRFNVLTYTPAANGVVIQKRFENEVIKCSCQYGAGGTNLPAIYRTAQWPAIWNGDHYELYAPSPAAAAPGQALSSGPTSGVEQSPLCQECCRDHHDTLTAGVVKFDPERSDNSVSKYDPNGSGTLVEVNNTNNGTYVDACRVIRVDGFWRTASDMYSRQFGLLETETVSGAKAKTGLPTSAATTAYTSFVKNYLKLYDGTTANNPPTGAQALFDGTTGINVPTLVTIAAASNSDARYLHARGLYVDHLEAKALQKLVDVLADNGAQGRCPTGSNIEDCVLPYLPFTSANLTEIAKWLASNTSILTVNSGNLLATDPAQPSGSRTFGKAVGTSDNTGSARNSNSGVAVNTETAFATLGGVDPTDDSQVSSDVQPFQVGGTVNAGPTFDVRVAGGGGNPFVFFTLGTDANVECIKPASGDHHCVTSTGTVMPQGGAITLSHYWSETTTKQDAIGTCSKPDGTMVPVTGNNVNVPTFTNYRVSSAVIGTTSGTIGLPTNDNHMGETTTVSFLSVPANALIQITLVSQASTGSTFPDSNPTYATVASCTTNSNGNQLNNVVWNTPWNP